MTAPTRPGFLRSALQGAGIAVLVSVGIAGAALLLNWAFLLFGIGPIRDAMRGDAPDGGVGPFSYGFLVLLLGIAFPIGWLIAAQQHAARLAARRVFRNHKAEVVAILTRAIEREVGEQPDDAARWAAAFKQLRTRMAEYPGVLQPVIRLALRRAKVDQLEQALLRGTGPVSTRFAGVTETYIEEEIIGSGAKWLWLVFALNAAAIVGILLAVRAAG